MKKYRWSDTHVFNYLLNGKTEKDCWNNIISLAITVLFIVCLVLLAFTVMIYRKTIIEIRLLVVIMFIIPIITTFFTYDFLLKYEKDVIVRKRSLCSIFFAYIYNWVVFGGAALFIFFSSNICFLSETTKVEEVYIEKIDKLPPGRRSKKWTPYMEVQFSDGIKKEIFLEEVVLKNLSVGQTYDLKIKEGFWGFDVIVE